MVIKMKHVDYHYKHSSLNPENDKEVQLYSLINEYGYNFGTESKRVVSEDVYIKQKNIVNKDFINLKR